MAFYLGQCVLETRLLQDAEGRKVGDTIPVQVPNSRFTDGWVIIKTYSHDEEALINRAVEAFGWEQFSSLFTAQVDEDPYSP